MAPSFSIKPADAIKGLLIAILYFATARLGLAVATAPEQVTAIWPPTGIAMAAMAIYGYRFWPAVTAGAFAANMLANEPVLVALCISIGNTLQGVASAGVFRRLAGRRLSLNHVKGIIALVAGAVSGTLFSATLGTSALWLGGLVHPHTSFGSAWLLWWLGDSMGAIIFAPVILTWAFLRSRSRARAGLVESIICVSALVIVSQLIFSGMVANSSQLKFVIFPFVILAAYRLDQKVTSLAILLVCGIALWGLLSGATAFRGETLNEKLLLMQGYITVFALTALVIGAVTAEQRETEAELRHAQENLEHRIGERTAELQATVGELRCTEAALQKSYDELEGRVHERTAALSGATDALRYSEQRLQAIVDNSTAVIHLKDPEGRYLLVNHEWENANGMSRADVIGRTPYEVYPTGAAEELLANDRQVLASGEAVQIEEIVPHPSRGARTYLSNKFPLFDKNGAAYAVCGIATDITDRKQAELAIADSEARKRAILESALDCVITIDHQGMVLEWNPAAEATLGYSAEEAVGRDMADLIIPEPLRQGHREGLKHFLNSGEGQMLGRRVELPALRKDGSEFPAELAITLVPVNGPPIFTGFLRDITERKRSEERERHSRQVAEAANRAKDEFLAVVSHELRTPLSPILGWTRMLRTKKLQPEQMEHALEVIERNVRAQGQLVEDLLDISRIITGKLRLDIQPLSLAAVVNAALETVRPAAESKNISIDVSLDMTDELVRGDSDRLQQVVWNLIANAIKFTPHNGRISIELSRVDSSAVIKVKDNGAGIPASFLPYMFNRFSQADSSTTRSQGGLGLGLAIVRHIVELHGGTVTADSAGKDLGATFTVTLPVNRVRLGAGDGAPQYTPPEGSAAVPYLTGLKILVVDDELDSLEFIGIALEHWGALVTTASSVPDAMQKMKSAQPDLVISDIGMPGEDGYALIRRVRQQNKYRTRPTPVIALTAFARAEDRRRILSEGFKMHIAKPVDPVLLATAVANLTRK